MMPYFSIEKIGPFYTWGLFLALGFLAPFIFVLKNAKNREIDPKIVWDILLWIIVGSVIGMRLGYVLQFPKEYLLSPVEILKFWDGGLTFFGGLIGGIIGAVFYRTYDKKLSTRKDIFWRIADLVALYFPLGIITARIGCLLINDHQGAITSLPWGIVWPDGTIRHPVALYLILNGSAIFLILNILKNKFKKPGGIFFFFLLFYSLTRFFLDLTRSSGTPLSDPSILGLNVSQWVSIIIFLFIVFKKVVDRLF
ncbi:hypothetical protein COV89_03840 [Candidatus Shapirobacteria bacterium CG11_big_fil_rev_8_21_14_0_20_40_12]|uniref:Phosphatidylglycerol--prolipoprotein diacylglyceryl transferase n=1 Tax=Candidatus Shapirobacteria bacterium CG11_big_fil_rev_8_21_14_0_20_40_12 TaxID=1974889 RepID=A0A2H0KGS7_9BACT|nr:MAG: hypothetical protein COV89_03840 [Candidatus Shapirobacteria bacterium CG11_big_fil_rev_8_21_14_0_20_40_12]